MKAIKELIQQTTNLAQGNREDNHLEMAPSGPFKAVTDLARKRYGFQTPVLISQKAYQQCVAGPAARKFGEEAQEGPWMRKILALAKYAIRHSPPGATSTAFVVLVNDHKRRPKTEPLKATVYCVSGQLPVLLIQHTSENSGTGLDKLMDDLRLVVSNSQEAV